MADGYIKLWRKTVDSAVFADPHLFQLWVHLLTSANWKESQWIDGSTVHPGEVIISQVRAGEMFGCSHSTIGRRLKRLEKLGNVALKSHTKWTHVTICNWRTYQQDDEEACTQRAQVTHIKRTGDAQVTHTSKKGRREEGKKKGGFDPSKADIPSVLQTSAFANAWQDWCRHRDEKKKPLTPTSVSRQLKSLSKIGPDRAIAKIDYTIEMGWEGLRDPVPSQNGQSRLASAEEDAEWTA